MMTMGHRVDHVEMCKLQSWCGLQMRDRRQTFWIHDAPPGACMPSIQYTEVWRQLDMSQKKSPPPKQEKIFTTVKTPQADGKSLKRKLITPGSPGEEDDKRTDRTPKRKRASIGLESSPLAGAASQNKTPTNPQRLGTHNVPLSERQQLAMIIRMTDENSQDSSPKHQSSTPPQITPGKRTPGDKKVHKRNERGETQLHIAAKKGDIKHTKKLIKAGADVNVRDFAGWTALHEACNHGCLDVAKQLLKAGANVNVQGLDKDTPLHDASICGHQKLVELLLKHGANPLQANSKGKTAVDVACSPEIATLLRKEILSSSSDSSSMDDIRSPTSPESTCDDRQGREDDRQVDIDAFALRISTQISSGCVTSPTVSRSNNMGIPVSGMGGIVTSEVQEEMPFAGSHYSSHFGDLSAVALAKRAVPKSPEGKTNSPRLCLKFRPNDGVNSESSDLSKDWRRPQYKSYSVTLETGERKGSPANSASSSNSSDLYDPQIDSGARLKFAENVLHSRNNGDGLISSSNSIACQPADSFSRFDMNSSDRGPGGSAGSAPSKPPLVSIQTGPFSPQFEDISDSEQEESQLPLHSDQSANKASVSSSHVTSQFSRIPVIRSSVIGEPLSKDEEIDSDNGLFPPRNRSSSCVTSSKDHIRQNAVDGRERTRHNSAPDKKNISEHDSVSLKALEVSVSDSSHVDHWDSITSSGIPSITQAEQPSCRPHETLHRTASENSALSPSSKDDSKLPRTFSQPDPSSQPGKPFFKMDIKYSPKVPPLKIILPTKTTATAGQVDRAGSPSVSALPYVVNAASTGEGEPAAGSVSQDTSQASSTASSRPSSRASSPSDSHDKVDIGKIVDRLTSQAEEEDAQAAKELENQSKTETNEVKPTEKDGEDKTKTKETKVEKEEKTTMVLRDRDKGKEQPDSNKEKEKDKDKDTKEPSLTEKESDKDQKESKEQKEERRTTRTLRSHTQMLLQQQQQQQQAQQKNTETQDTKTGSSQNDSSHEENSTNQPKAEEQPDEGLTNRKRKLRPKPETSGSDSQPLPPIQYEKPPNPYELFRSIRSQVAMRRNNLVIVAPKPPQGYKDFKIVNCSYVLHGNQASRLAVPMLTPPNSVTGPIRDLFMEQEKARYKLRLQHIVEREKLMMTVEQEVLRLHGRAARATINQSLPLGVCTVLKDEEIYNIFEMEERDKNVRTRYNGRQFLSWYHDVVDKFDKIKSYLLLRHHHEAESLFAVQKMDWEWKLKELGLCDSNTTPVIDELHVPMVQVNEEFELLPA